MRYLVHITLLLVMAFFLVHFDGWGKVAALLPILLFLSMVGTDAQQKRRPAKNPDSNYTKYRVHYLINGHQHHAEVLAKCSPVYAGHWVHFTDQWYDDGAGGTYRPHASYYKPIRVELVKPPGELELVSSI